MKKHTMSTKLTYETDCNRAVKDEDGDALITRVKETRPVSVTLVEHDGAVFWKGGRIA